MNSLRAPTIILFIWCLATLFWWGLAFYPQAVEPAPWLQLAREVCFGTQINGLPGPAGWMMLILGPISFLIAFMVAWPGELHRSMRWAIKHTSGRLVLTGLAILFSVESVWLVQGLTLAWEKSQIDFSNQSLEELPVDYPMLNAKATDFTLVNQIGESVQLSQMVGNPVLLTFAFAHCQTVCPVLVQENIAALENSAAKQARLLVITLDPWRDTPQSLPDLAKKWNLPANAFVLSGKVDQVLQVLKDYQIPYQRNDKTGDVVHPALTYIIHPNGTIAYKFNNVPVKWLSMALDRMNHAMDSTASR